MCGWWDNPSQWAQWWQLGFMFLWVLFRSKEKGESICSDSLGVPAIGELELEWREEEGPSILSWIIMLCCTDVLKIMMVYKHLELMTGPLHPVLPLFQSQSDRMEFSILQRFCSTRVSFSEAKPCYCCGSKHWSYLYCCWNKPLEYGRDTEQAIWHHIWHMASQKNIFYEVWNS